MTITSESNQTTGVSSRAPKRLLLVDDDEPFRKALAQLLLRAGYEVLQADNAELALLLLLRCKVDLVVSDILMAEKDGLELLMEMKRLALPAKAIAISGGGHLTADHYLFIAMRLGAHAAIAKPFGGHELLAAVRCAFGEN